MAYIDLFYRQHHSAELIRYAVNPEKTDDPALITAVGCTVFGAAQEMAEARKAFRKDRGVRIFHLIQDFLPGEAEPELVHMIGNRLAKEIFEDYQYIVATHTDRDHAHNHILANAVSDRTGRKFCGDLKAIRRRIWEVSNELCLAAGLADFSEHREGNRDRTYVEQKLREDGYLTFRELLEQDLKEAAALSENVRDLYEIMEGRGYLVEPDGEFPTFTPSGSTGKFYARRNGEPMREKDLEQEILRLLNDPETVLPERKKLPEYRPTESLAGLQKLYDAWIHTVDAAGREGIHVPDIPLDGMEVLRLRRYRKQEDYLKRSGIMQEEQLEARIGELTGRIGGLEDQQRILHSRKNAARLRIRALELLEQYRRAGNWENPEEFRLQEDMERLREAQKQIGRRDPGEIRRDWAENQKQRRELTDELRGLRKELHMCTGIREDAGTIRAWLDEIERGRERERKRNLLQERADR